MEHNCKECKKEYKSYMGLWIHNRKYHKKTKIIETITTQNVNNITEAKNKNSCKICNKVLSCRSSKSRHEKVCRKKQLLINNTKEIKLHKTTKNKKTSQKNKVPNTNDDKKEPYHLETKEEQVNDDKKILSSIEVIKQLKNKLSILESFPSISISEFRLFLKNEYDNINI